MKWLNKKVLLFYSVSNITYQLFFAACEIILLRFINPELIGVWQFIVLIQSYAYVSRLGVLSAINREYPFYLGKEEHTKAEDIYGTGYSYSWVNGALLLVFFLILGFVWNDRAIEWRWASWAMGIIVLLEMTSTYYESTLRSINKFQLLAKFQLFLIPILALSLLLPWKLDFLGLCLRATLIAIVRIAYLHLLVIKAHHITLTFDRKTLEKLLGIGWKMWLWGYLKNINKSIPKLIIASLETTLVLGLFTPINWMKTIFYNFATSIGAYIYPNLSYQYAKQNLKVGANTLRITVFTALFSIPFVIVGVLLIPIMVKLLLPQYITVILPMQIALISSIFEIFMISNMAFATKKAWKLMYVHILVTILIRFIGIFTCYQLFEDKLLGIAYGLLFTSVLVAFITTYLVSKVDKYEAKGNHSP